MRRSALVCVLVLLLLAGYTAGPLGGPAADAVDGPTGCDPVNVPRPDDAILRIDSLNESPAYPELPATLNSSTARQFAVDFEETFAWHRAHSSTVDEIHVRTYPESVGPDPDGYVVDIGTVEISTVDESPEGDAVGSNGWSAVYLVNDSTVLRGEGHAGDGEQPPRSEWHVVCERTDG